MQCFNKIISLLFNNIVQHQVSLQREEINLYILRNSRFEIKKNVKNLVNLTWNFIIYKAYLIINFKLQYLFIL